MTAAPAGTRLASIDALRGFDMFWITGGTNLFLALSVLIAPPMARILDVQFNHSAWNGFTFFDLVFPLFIFVSGLTIPFSITKRVERGDDRAALYRHVAIRVSLLFVLGLWKSGIHLDPFSMRIPGVLQRIAICSGVASVIAMHTRPRTQVYITAGILLGYWALMALVSVPGVGAGHYTPDGNLAGYIDRLLLPFPDKWCCYTFGDSEGVLTTLPAVATAMLGVLAGHRLRASGSPWSKMSWLIIAGVSCLALGLAWATVFPINKYLWTSSYVLYSAGWSMLMTAAFFWIIDVKAVSRWSFFFRVIGSNSIVIYMLEAPIRFVFLKTLFGASAALALLIACLDVSVRWLVVYYLYRKKWFLKF